MSHRDLLPDGAADFFAGVPTPERVALEIRSWGAAPGYRAMFGRRWSDLLGLPPDAIEAVAGLKQRGFLTDAAKILGPYLPDAAGVAEQLRAAGITTAVVHSPLPSDVSYPIDATAELVAVDHELYVGFTRIDPADPRGAASTIRRGAIELGLRGVTLTPFWHGVRCSDPELRPIFDAASELDVIMWIHTSMNWTTHRPLDLEHPRHIDELAGRYPNLRIVCGHAGWPWVQDLIAVAWRHPNVFIDYSAFLPRHIHTQGSGWEPLAYYGARTVGNKLLYGTTWTLLGLTPEALLDEAASVPWPDEMKQRWLHDNAVQLLAAR